MDEDMRMAIQLSKQEQTKTAGSGGGKASLEAEFKSMKVAPQKKKGPTNEMAAMMMDTAGFNKLL